MCRFPPLIPLRPTLSLLHRRSRLPTSSAVRRLSSVACRLSSVGVVHRLLSVVWRLLSAVCRLSVACRLSFACRVSRVVRRPSSIVCFLSVTVCHLSCVVHRPSSTNCPWCRPSSVVCLVCRLSSVRPLCSRLFCRLFCSSVARPPAPTKGILSYTPTCCISRHLYLLAGIIGVSLPLLLSQVTPFPSRPPFQITQYSSCELCCQIMQYILSYSDPKSSERLQRRCV